MWKCQLLDRFLFPQKEYKDVLQWKISKLKLAWQKEVKVFSKWWVQFSIVKFLFVINKRNTIFSARPGKLCFEAYCSEVFLFEAQIFLKYSVF